jgi:hypothetical protein
MAPQPGLKLAEHGAAGVAVSSMHERAAFSPIPSTSNGHWL